MKLRNQWKQYNPMQPPEYWRKWEPMAGERPDVVISDPSKSYILEVRAAELLPTEKYPTGISLRFPRVNKIRYDKSWELCMTMDELKELKTNFNANMSKKD
jgi:DNA ligase-4